MGEMPAADWKWDLDTVQKINKSISWTDEMFSLVYNVKFLC